MSHEFGMRDLLLCIIMVMECGWGLDEVMWLISLRSKGTTTDRRFHGHGELKNPFLSYWRIKRENRSNENERVCKSSEELRKSAVNIRRNLSVYFGYIGGKTPGQIEPKFFRRRYPRRNHFFKFGDDRFRGLASADCQILPFLLTLTVVLTTLSRYRVSV